MAAVKSAALGISFGLVSSSQIYLFSVEFFVKATRARSDDHLPLAVPGCAIMV